MISSDNSSLASNEIQDSPAFLSSLVGFLEARKDRPSWDEYFMATAFLMASRSSCERLQVGCVLVSAGENANRIVAAGYNGFLPGVAHISHVRDGHEQATVHAEQNAVTDAARRGVALQGTTGYLTHYPCINCAKILAAAGIKRIKFHHDYRNDELVGQIFAEAGISIQRIV